VTDCVVIGGGHNGLVAANVLADHGWSVLVLEAASEPGGGVRSAELIEPGFTNDVCSAFYPLTAVSPAIGALGLEEWGLRWRRSPLVVGHPAPDGTCPTISTDLDVTCASLDELHPGDGARWRDLYDLWERMRPAVTDVLLTPFPPVRAGVAAAVRGRHDLGRLLRLATIPVRRLGTEELGGPPARRLLAGLALHADLMPEAVLSGAFGWLLACMAQEVGFPVPEGGAGQLTAALVRRLEARGGQLRCNTPVDAIEVTAGRATAVRTAAGTVVTAARAVLADVDAVQLYLHLVDAAALPSSTLRNVRRFEWDHATFKVDWNLDGSIPWSAEPARSCGTVHVVDDVDELTMTAATLSTNRIPARPFLVMGQQAVVDPTRQPQGTDTAFAYTHLPRTIVGDAAEERLTGDWAGGDAERFADRVEARIEALAPGFRDRIRGRHILTPDDFTRRERNMPLGALNLGTSQLHQQLVLRPIPGLGRAETPIRSLFLASASAHPGGGVHGACGANAARAALAAARRAPWRNRRRASAPTASERGGGRARDRS
jgi:phytoene dehydrogenase-like protein